MKQRVNTVYKDLFTTDKRYVILMGGRGAGRSTVASQYAMASLVGDGYFRCAIMRYIKGDIRNSIYKEIVDRVEDGDIEESIENNSSTMSFTYSSNNINAVGFKKSSGDQKSKLKSLANYNCVIIEEADEISEEDFIQLDDSLRTIKNGIKIVLLLNPPSKNHWIIKRWFDLEDSGRTGFYLPKLKPHIKDTCVIRSSYLDNKKNISKGSVDNYERYKENKPEHYYNMIMGYVPEVLIGRIFSNWKVINEIPHEARLFRRGLDFGYTNDPSVLVDIYEYNGGFLFNEIFYEKGMSNKKIADVIRSQQEQVLVKGDSSEPKSIDEIKSHGIMIQPAIKGAGSVSAGISFLKEQIIYITRSSVNLMNEYENYAWMKDRKNGTLHNTPEDKFNHGMDAIRYAIYDPKKRQEPYTPMLAKKRSMV